MQAFRSRIASRALRVGRRNFSAEPTLRERLVQIMPEKQEAMRKLQKQHADVKIGDVTIGACVGGMRGLKAMVWDTSLLDTEEGIRFRGHTIPDLQRLLPKAPGKTEGEPLPEGLLWLLLTGEVPSEQQVRDLTADLHSRAELPAHVETMIRNFPKHMHPMTQLCSAVLACQTESKFAAAYASGIHKKDYWDPCLEDSLDLIAKLPRIAALIYRLKFHDGKIADYDKTLDYSANFNRMLGFPAGGFPEVNPDTDAFDELMRMYLVIHADHEGGNVSAHATHLVGSALSDPYLSFNAGMSGLAGPLHGLANQEVLKWTLNFEKAIKDQGKEITHETIKDQAWATLNSGNVIPGFGHAVLRKTDPRYTSQREFALKHMAEDPLFKTVAMIYEVMPDVLTEHGKTKNPYPNVDAHSGCLLKHYGLVEYDYYTVLFGVSRAYGVLSQLFWDRACGLPLERPKSVTSAWLQEQADKAQ